MDLHPDLMDPLGAFSSLNVEYLVVGGWAVAVHAEPRFTKDLDIWIGSVAACPHPRTRRISDGVIGPRKNEIAQRGCMSVTSSDARALRITNHRGCAL